MSLPWESESPQAAAVRWVEAVMGRGDLAEAWPGTDPVLRLVLAQEWVWSRRHDPAIGHEADWDEIANGLARGPGGHALWDRFAGDLISMWRQSWSGFDPATWDVRAEPEVLDLDLEMVTFAERGPVSEHPAGAAFARRFAMRHTGKGWLVAGINGDQLFRPGWPPRIGRSA